MLFTVEEDKQGFFVAKLRPKQFLDKAQFKTMCALARDLGGEGYLQGAKAWAVPGPFAKKSSEVPSKPETDFLATHKAPGNALPAEPSGKVLFAMLPVKALLSTPFQSRDDPDDPELADLAESLKAYGVLEPIVVRQKPNGLYEIAIGERRVKAARKAGLIEVPAIVRAMSDEEVAVCNLIENIHRKDLSDKEKTKALTELAKTRGWNAQQIAEKIRMSYTWVTKYLPDEFKAQDQARLGALGGQAASEAYKATQRVAEESQDAHEIAHPEEKPIIILCARCGEPIQGTPVHLGEGNRFYDAECAEAVVAEAKSGHGPSIAPESGAEEQEKEVVEEGEKREKVEGKLPLKRETKDRDEEKASRGLQLRAVQIGEFECTECHQHFFVHHLLNGKHKLEAIRKEEQ